MFASMAPAPANRTLFSFKIVEVNGWGRGGGSVEREERKCLISNNSGYNGAHEDCPLK